MRIGISTLSTAGQNVWSAGITQNALFLAKLLRAIPFVTDVVLLDVGTEQDLGPQVDLDWFGARFVKLAEGADQVDLIIEMVGAIDPAWMQLQRARGKKSIWYCVGQPYSGLVETTLFKENGFFLRTESHDAIWLLPKDEAFEPMLRTLYRTPVFLTPYIWDPIFLQQRIDEVGKLGWHYGYVPEAEQEGPVCGWRLATFEPNISPIKSGLIPLLIAETALRRDPDSIGQLHMLNMLHLVEHPTLLYLANSLDIVRTHRTIFSGRVDIASFMAEQRVNAIVSHQWQNDQNYVYLDALYGNYPLIHNSPWLKDAGYYYPDFDIQCGAEAVLSARDCHDRELTHYGKRAAQVLKAVSISHEPNVEAFAELLRAVCHDRPQWLEN